MEGFEMTWNRSPVNNGAFLFALGTLALAHCSGSSSPSPTPASTATAVSTASAPATTPPPFTATASPVPTASPAVTTSPTIAPSSGATSVAATTTLESTVTFPTVAGIGLTLSFSATPNPSGGTVVVNGYNYAPPVSVPTNPPSSMPSPSGAATPTVVAAWVFSTTPSATVVAPAITVTGLPSPPPGTSYYSYFADVSQDASSGYSGPFTETNGTVIENASGSGTTLPAGDKLLLEIVTF